MDEEKKKSTEVSCLKKQHETVQKPSLEFAISKVSK